MAAFVLFVKPLGRGGNTPPLVWPILASPAGLGSQNLQSAGQQHQPHNDTRDNIL